MAIAIRSWGRYASFTDRTHIQQLLTTSLCFNHANPGTALFPPMAGAKWTRNHVQHNERCWKTFKSFGLWLFESDRSISPLSFKALS